MSAVRWETAISMVASVLVLVAAAATATATAAGVLTTTSTTTAAWQYAGCYSHSTQALIESWDRGTVGMSFSDCSLRAEQVAAPWFVLEFPEGRRSNAAGCGLGGDFAGEGRVADED